MEQWSVGLRLLERAVRMHRRQRGAIGRLPPHWSALVLMHCFLVCEIGTSQSADVAVHHCRV